MKEWILELCPEIESWQAELIAEQANQAVLAEREACAKVCEIEASVIVTNASQQYQDGRSMGATVCANAIRARIIHD